jgi:regulator of protease activity HflC (stomatin/prohibitin superfamily)
VYYRVNNATISIANVENAHHSTRLLAQTTLRNTMGTRHLHEILSERMTISGSMQVSGPLWINYGDYGVQIIRGPLNRVVNLGR